MLIHSKKLFGGLAVIEPRRIFDQRGYFQESYNKRYFAELGIYADFVQDNHAYTQKEGVVRGLHFQSPPFGQDKLIRCTNGRIFDLVLDIRKDSQTFHHYFKIELSCENGLQLFVPAGFAHGYCTLEADCEVQYKVSNYYNKASEGGISPLDGEIRSLWPSRDLTLSEKDHTLPSLADFSSPF